MKSFNQIPVKWDEDITLLNHRKPLSKSSFQLFTQSNIHLFPPNYSFLLSLRNNDVFIDSKLHYNSKNDSFFTSEVIHNIFW